ncbi:hypothetical protein HPP92_002772 [Vanilla planifolia]|uniref:Uncharacterized protein n=1 Tax=Vanilla planifolia TaxID=51239 RepID=A0A835S1T1_VANPL|nr:hypothetical protein HPP92_002772 [Vanilla planifolia]
MSAANLKIFILANGPARWSSTATQPQISDLLQGFKKDLRVKPEFHFRPPPAPLLLTASSSTFNSGDGHPNPRDRKRTERKAKMRMLIVEPGPRMSHRWSGL